MKELLHIARGSGLNLCIVSSSGTGKSTIVEAFAKEIGVHCETLIVSNMEATEIVGIPYINKDDSGSGTLESAKPEWLKNLEKHGGNGILLIDEISNARPDVQTPLLSMLTARKAGVYDIPKDVQFVFAMNDSTSSVDYYGMGEALRDRLCFVEHAFDKKAFKEVFKEDKAIIGLINLVSKPKNTIKINIQDYVVESYRTYGYYLNNLLKYIAKHYNEIDLDAVNVLVHGLMLEENAEKVYHYISEEMIKKLQLRHSFDKAKKVFDGFFNQYQSNKEMIEGYTTLDVENQAFFDEYIGYHMNKLLSDLPDLDKHIESFKDAMIDHVYQEKDSIYQRYVTLRRLQRKAFNEYLESTSMASTNKDIVDKTLILFKEVKENFQDQLLYEFSSKNNEEKASINEEDWDNISLEQLSRKKKEIKRVNFDKYGELVSLIELYVPNTQIKDDEQQQSKDTMNDLYDWKTSKLLEKMKGDSIYTDYMNLGERDKRSFNRYLYGAQIKDQKAIYHQFVYDIKDIVDFLNCLGINDYNHLLGEFEQAILTRWNYIKEINGLHENQVLFGKVIDKIVEEDDIVTFFYQVDEVERNSLYHYLQYKLDGHKINIPFIEDKLDFFVEKLMDQFLTSETNYSNKYETYAPFFRNLMNQYLYHTKIDSINKERYDQILKMAQDLSKGKHHLLGPFYEYQTNLDNGQRYSEKDLVHLIDMFPNKVMDREISKLHLTKQDKQIEEDLYLIEKELSGLTLYEKYQTLNKNDREKYNYFLIACYIDQSHCHWPGLSFENESVMAFIKELENNNALHLLGQHAPYIQLRWQITNDYKQNPLTMPKDIDAYNKECLLLKKNKDNYVRTENGKVEYNFDFPIFTDIKDTYLKDRVLYELYRNGGFNTLELLYREGIEKRSEGCSDKGENVETLSVWHAIKMLDIPFM